MFKEGFIVPMMALIFGFGYLFLRDVVKDQTLVLIEIKGYPNVVFSISEYSLRKLEANGLLSAQCAERFFALESDKVSILKKPFDVPKKNVVICDRL